MSRYGVTTETTDSSYRSMQAGVNRNAIIESVKVASPRKDGTGDKQIIIELSGAPGQHRQIEWQIVESRVETQAKTEWEKSIVDDKPLLKRDKKPFASEEEYVEQRIENAYGQLNSRLKHWAKSVEEDENKIVFIGDDFETFAQSFADFMNARIKNKQVDLLLSMDAKGNNLTTPSYPPFVEASGTVPTRLSETDKRIKYGTAPKPDTEVKSSANLVQEEEEF